MSFLFSWIWNWGKPQEEASTPQEAIEKLNETMTLLEKKQIFLEEKIDEELLNAKKQASTNKKAALMSLAKKKRLEKQLAQIDGTLTTMECQKDALENAASNTEVMKALQFSAKSLKLIHQDMDIDKIHNIMDDVSEQQELSSEIASAMATPFGNNAEVDEDDLLAELEGLQEEAAGGLDVTLNLPEAPAGDLSTSTPEKHRSQEDAELAELMQMTN